MLASLALFLALQERPPLERMADLFKGHKSVSFEIAGGRPGRTERIRGRFLAPNLYSLVGDDHESRSDGTQAWSIFPKEKTYTREDLAAAFPPVASLPGFGLVFPSSPPPKAKGPAAKGEFAGKPVLEIPIEPPPSAPTGFTVSLLLDPQTATPRGLLTFRNGEPYETYAFENVVLDPPLTPADFAYAPPAGYRDTTEPKIMVGPALYQAMTKPGVWVEGVRLDPKVRLVGGYWAFDLDLKKADAFRWAEASASATVGGKTVRATAVKLDAAGGRVVIVVPRSGGRARPDGLTVMALRKDGRAEVVFEFEFALGAR